MPITKTAQFTKDDLTALQKYPRSVKVARTQTRIAEWYRFWDQKVYISFSGGKDSTVLADLAARVCKGNGWDLVLLFIDTGLEYPEIRQFVKFFAQWLRERYQISVILEIRRPAEDFSRVIQRKGVPLIGKEISRVVNGALRGAPSCLRKLNGEKLDHFGNKSKYNLEKWKFLLYVPFIVGDGCCHVMKKAPASKFERETGLKMMTGEIAEESQLRQTNWLINGCNAFDLERPKSTPMAFWTEQDVLWYLFTFQIPFACVYGDIVYETGQMSLFAESERYCTTGCDRTGCMFCGFGILQEKGENRFQRMKRTHPKQYAYCMAEPKIIHRRTGREMFRLHDFRMSIAYRLRQKYGDDEFDSRFKVVGGLGMKSVLDYMKIAC